MNHSILKISKEKDLKKCTTLVSQNQSNAIFARVYLKHDSLVILKLTFFCFSDLEIGSYINLHFKDCITDVTLVH